MYFSRGLDSNGSPLSYDEYVSSLYVVPTATYGDSIISLTSKDALGLLQVESAFNHGQEFTLFKWQNGTVTRIEKADFSALAEFFATERNKLFIGE